MTNQTQSTTPQAFQSGPLTLRLERTIRAPRARVFEAWTNPEEMKRWSAPAGMTVPEGEQDLRVGGKFRAVMLEPDGTKHVVLGQYREVTPPSRLVYTHMWLQDNGRSNETTPETIVTVEFVEEKGATRVVLTQTGFASKESRDGHNGGWSSTLDKFAAIFKP